MTTEGHWQHAGAPPAGDFVATLGARVTDLRRTVDTLSREPGSASMRARFLRRLHALGAAARSLGFFGVAQRLLDMKSMLEAGEATTEDLAAIGRALGEIADVASGEQEASMMPEASPGTLPATVCVVGDEAVEALLRESSSTALCGRAESNLSPMAFASARVPDPSSARSQLGPYAPDLFLVDLDLPGAFDLIRDLVDDPKTDLVPIVAVGGNAGRQDASECTALGVTRTFSRPVDVVELRKTCIDAVEQRRGRTVRMSLPPEPEAARAVVAAFPKAERRAAPAAAAPQGTPPMVSPPVVVVEAPRATANAPSRTSTNPLQTPFVAPPPLEAELLPEVAVEVVELEIEADEIAADMANVVPCDPGSFPSNLGGLVGRRVVVASAEPAVGWFLADELSKLGCAVTEAPGGAGVRDLVLEVGRHPLVDVVVAEVDMDGAGGGVALARAIRADAVARDAVIILLSRDEASLQLAHEAGVGAACLRLGAPLPELAAAAVERLAELGRVERDVRSGLEASGSLLGVTTRRLLSIACEAEASCRIRLFDGVFLFELFVHGGDILRATRTAPTGRVEVGERALATALGVDYGSFTIEPLDRSEMEGLPEPSELLAKTVRVRCAMKRCLEGLEVSRVARLTLDDDMTHWASTLDSPVRDILGQIAAGFSPRLLAHMAGFSPGDIAVAIETILERGFVLSVRDELADIGHSRPIALLPAGQEEATAPCPPVGVEVVGEESPVDALDAAILRSPILLAPAVFARPTAEDPRLLTPPPLPTAGVSDAAPRRLELPAALAAPGSGGPTRMATVSPARGRPFLAAAEPLLRPDESPLLPEIPLPGVRRSDPFLATSVTAPPPPTPRRRTRMRTAALLLVVASMVGVGARVAVSGGSLRAPAAAAQAGAARASAPAPATPALPPQGLLEVTAPDSMTIVVDGTERGHGPRLSVTLAEGMHELGTDAQGSGNAAPKKRFIEIARGRVTHVDLTLAAPPGAAAAPR